MSLDLDVAIFIAFLALNLVVGLRYGRNVKTIQDYALGGRNFTTGALVATIVGTCVSGSGFFITLSHVYSDGLYFLIASTCGDLFPLLFVAFVLAPRMGEFLGKVSIAEAMGDIYGQSIRIIVAVTAIIGGVGMIAVQFKAFGNIFHYFLEIDGAIAVVAAGIVMTIFSTLGGIRAITFTDILQCITFGVAIPLIGLLVWHQLNHDGSFSLSAALDTPMFNVVEVANLENPKFWAMLPLLLYFAVPALSPTDTQKVMMGTNIAQVKRAHIIAAVLVALIYLSIAWIPFLVYNVNPDLKPNELLPYIVDHYTYPGLKGMMIVAIVALAMSTADAYMNIASVLFSHDICKPLGIISSKNELMASRIFASFLGAFAVALALSKADLLGIVLSANAFYMPIVTTPLLMTILGFRSSTLSVLIGMGAGLATVVIWKFLGIEADCIVIAMTVNLIFLLGSHYVLSQKGGFVGVKDKTFLTQEAQDRRLRYNRFKRQLRDFRLLTFIKELAPKNELMYSGFGVYCIICTFATMYVTDSELVKDESRVIMHFYQVMLVTGTMMGSFPIWPTSIKKEIIVQIWWPIAMFYMLGFFSAFFLMVTGFEGFAFAIFTLNSVVAFTIAGWRLGAVMITSGFYLASIAYQIYANTTHIGLPDTYSPTAIFMYLSLLLGAAVIIFLKPKEEYAEFTETKIRYLQDTLGFQNNELITLLKMKNEFLRNIEHESRTPITGIATMAEVLEAGFDKLNEDQIKGGIREIVTSSERLNSWASNLVDLSRLSAKGETALSRTTVNLSELVEERLGICQKLYIAEKDIDNRVFVLNLGKNIIAYCDRYYISRVIDNLIINAIQYTKNGKIEVKLFCPEQALLSQITSGKLSKSRSLSNPMNNSASTSSYMHKISSVEFSIQDEGMGIPFEDLQNIFGLLTVSSKTKSVAGGRGVGLNLCKKIIELHEGKIWAESDGLQGSKFMFSLHKSNVT
ncbi:MAG: ATP-binding protein [Pseudomonadota bacterium]